LTEKLTSSCPPKVNVDYFQAFLVFETGKDVTEAQIGHEMARSEINVKDL